MPEGKDEESPATEAVAGVVTLVTLLAGFGLLALGWPYFWVAFPVGFGGLLPAGVAVAKWYAAGSEGKGDSVTPELEAALAELRERYARGEVDEMEFERRVERLLETESVAAAEDAYGNEEPALDGPERGRSVQRDRETERS
jgi:uncharacterized membrane protein